MDVYALYGIEMFLEEHVVKKNGSRVARERSASLRYFARGDRGE